MASSTDKQREGASVVALPSDAEIEKLTIDGIAELVARLADVATRIGDWLERDLEARESNAA